MQGQQQCSINSNPQKYFYPRSKVSICAKVSIYTNDSNVVAKSALVPTASSQPLGAGQGLITFT
jgi:hypothetical protein